MAKLQHKPTIRRTHPRGLSHYQGPYHPKIVDLLRAHKPWARFDRQNRTWVFPDYVRDSLHALLKKLEYVVDIDTDPPHPEMDFRLYPYQRADILAACRDGYRFLAYEMGLGKTPTAIGTLQALQAKRILIVCPASVREVWRDELDKWWLNHPTVTLITKGTDPIPSEGVVVTSYELLPAFLDDQGRAQPMRWDAIVADESHNIKNAQTARACNLQELSHANPQAMRLALSGTPIGDSPKDLHAQLDWLTPGRWGTYWQYANRFCRIDRHDFGVRVYGVRNEALLHKQFLTVGSRVTWQEHKHLLPKSRPPQTHRVEDREDGVLDLCSCVAGRAVVFTYYRRDVTNIAETLTELGRPVYEVTGEIQPAERYGILEAAKMDPRSLLVATMDSVGTGIDLTPFPVAIFAGLSYKLQTLLQAIGRVYRLTQTEPVQLHFVVRRGGEEEMIAETVTRKLAINTAVLDPGNAEEKLAELIGAQSMTDEQWLDELQTQLTETYSGDDEYL